MAELKHIVIQDGGDGSTFITLLYDDGSKTHANPDVPYEGAILLDIEDNKVSEESEIEEQSMEYSKEEGWHLKTKDIKSF